MLTARSQGRPILKAIAHPRSLAPLVSRRPLHSRSRFGAAMAEAPSAEGPGDEPAAEEQAAAAPAVDPLDVLLGVDATARAFPAEIPADGATKALAAVPPALYYPAVLAAAAAAGLAGATAGRAAVGAAAPALEHETRQLAGLAVGAAAAGAVAYAGARAKKVRDRAAVVDLFNLLVGLDDPADLSPDQVKAVGDRYGIDMRKDQLEGLQQIFGQYLENIVPKGDAQLTGDEAPKIAAFKDAIGLGDEDAAPVFIEVGRRLCRAGIEVSSRQGQFEQRKAFQRLIYLSYSVFGDQKAAFLLPWRRVFNLNDAQLFVARRDNARSIFAARLREACGGDLPADRTFLRELRDYQTAIRLMDDVAEDAVRAAARAHIEKNVAAAVAVVRSTAKSRDPTKVVAELRSALDYGRKLAKMANEDDLVPGLGLPSLHGGEWETDAKRRDVREAFRVFCEESVAAAGELTPALDADFKELAAMLCLGARETADVRAGVTAALYRKLLRDEVTSRRIDSAASPADVIDGLVRRSGFTADGAAALHSSLYRQKLSQLAAKRKLSEQDAADLARARRVLCIPDADADAALRDTAGRVLSEAVSDVFLNGAKPVPDIEMDRVASTAADLKLPPAVAGEVFAEAARARLRSYALQAAKDLARDKKAAAALKKLVQFNALVVTPMLERLTGKPVAAAAPSADAAPADAAAAALADARGDYGAGERREVQTEINIGGEVEEAVCAELYKAYLMHAMSGEAVELPVGGVVRKKTNPQARALEMARLSQLSALLGMPAAAVDAARQELAESAYRAQLADALRDAPPGPLSPERTAYLDEVRASLRLPEARAAALLSEVRAEVLGASAAAALLDGGGSGAGGQPKWTAERALKLAAEGADVTSMLEEGPRRALLRREIERRLTDGKAKFDAKLLLEDLPRVLGIDERKLNALLRELVGSRKRMLLVQAVSQHRQKRPGDAAVSLNNLLSAYRAKPESGGNAGAVQWGEREELRDLYGAYCAQVDAAAKRSELAALFGLSPEEADAAARNAGAPSAGLGAMGSLSADEDDGGDFFA